MDLMINPFSLDIFETHWFDTTSDTLSISFDCSRTFPKHVHGAFNILGIHSWCTLSQLWHLFNASSLTLQVSRTAVSNRLAKVQGFLFRSAFLRRVPVFIRLIIENILLCFLLSTLNSTSKYITGTLSLRFRKILTKLTHTQYFQVLLMLLILTG